jgi:hypothetical protein
MGNVGGERRIEFMTERGICRYAPVENLRSASGRQSDSRVRINSCARVWPVLVDPRSEGLSVSQEDAGGVHGALVYELLREPGFRFTRA